MELENLIITVDEAAKEWEVTTRTVRNWCENGLIEAKKLNREWAVLKGQDKPTTKSGPKEKRKNDI